MRLIDADKACVCLREISTRQRYYRLLINKCKYPTVNDVFEEICADLEGKGLLGFKVFPTELTWIPIKQRPGTDEEYEEYSKFGDCPREDFKVYEGPLPKDGEEVFITTRWGDTTLDTWRTDVDWCGFEEHDDPDDVIAWMPKPKGYVPEDKR